MGRSPFLSAFHDPFSVFDDRQTRCGGRPLVVSSKKNEKAHLTIKHRTAEGKFDQNRVIKLTGTSTLSLLSVQNHMEKNVLVQKAIDAKQRVEHQKNSVIYANAVHELILVSAVVQSY